MPTSRVRTRVEIDKGLHAQVANLALREGYPVSRFVDKLLWIAIHYYIAERRAGRYPFAEDPVGAAGLRSNPFERYVTDGSPQP